MPIKASDLLQYYTLDEILDFNYLTEIDVLDALIEMDMIDVEFLRPTTVETETEE